MTGVKLLSEAFDDIEEIREYIARDNPDAADRIVVELFEAMGTLPDQPRQGRLRPDLTTLPIRFKVVRDYLIAYAPEEIPLTVIAVVHGRRHPRAIAGLLRGRET